MTKAYLIGHITVTNPQAYAVYSAQVPHTIAAFGGKYLVRGGHATPLEGEPQGERHVVWNFQAVTSHKLGTTAMRTKPSSTTAPTTPQAL